MEKVSVFITGGGGFIGRHLMRILPATRYACFLLALPGETIATMEGCDITRVEGDLNDPASYLPALLQCSVVVHMAAELYREEHFERVNIQGVQTLLEAIKQCNIQKIIHLSSVGVVGMQFSLQDVCVDEEFPCAPKNGYERSKHASERILKEQWPESKLVILRPTNVYGDSHPGMRLLNLLQHCQQNGLVFLSARAKVNYVYAGDVAFAIRHCMDTPDLFGTFNVGGAMPMRDFFLLTGEVLGRKLRLKTLPDGLFRLVLLLKKVLPERYAAKILSLRNAVHYCDDKFLAQCSYPFGYRKGLTNTVNYYRSNQKLHD